MCICSRSYQESNRPSVCLALPQLRRHECDVLLGFCRCSDGVINGILFFVCDVWANDGVTFAWHCFRNLWSNVPLDLQLNNKLIDPKIMCSTTVSDWLQIQKYTSRTSLIDPGISAVSHPDLTSFWWYILMKGKNSFENTGSKIRMRACVCVSVCCVQPTIQLIPSLNITRTDQNHVCFTNTFYFHAPTRVIGAELTSISIF